MLGRLFLLGSASIVLGAMTATPAPQDPAAPVVGEGGHRYRWVKDCMKLPAGFVFGPTHGDIVVDSKDRIIISNDGENAIVICDTPGLEKLCR